MFFQLLTASSGNDSRTASLGELKAHVARASSKYLLAGPSCVSFSTVMLEHSQIESLLAANSGADFHRPHRFRLPRQHHPTSTRSRAPNNVKVGRGLFHGYAHRHVPSFRRGVSPMARSAFEKKKCKGLRIEASDTRTDRNRISAVDTSI